MTNTNPHNPKQIIKTLTILHYAYCLAVIVFGTTALFITDNASINFSNTDETFFYLIPIFAIGGVLSSNYIFRNSLKSIQQKSTLIEKLTHYQSVRIIRIALIEAPALLGIVIFMITSNQFYLIISAVLLAYMVLLRPTLPVIKTDLQLIPEQEREFREATK
ncbi:hypothetical protein [Winogradskyella sp.]|uniref:hypothetical protein n=1 Tax=Winogradskyella sp. TaxID=1883156 RepID=UPI003F6C2CBF